MRQLSETDAFVSTAIVLAVLLINHLPNISKWRNTLDQRMRRKMYLHCINHYENTKTRIVKSIISRIIFIPFKFKPLRHKSQEDILKIIIDGIRDNDMTRKLYFIEGESGSGKSSLISFLVRQLIYNPRIAHLSEQIYYFDKYSVKGSQFQQPLWLIPCQKEEIGLAYLVSKNTLFD